MPARPPIWRWSASLSRRDWPGRSSPSKPAGYTERRRQLGPEGKYGRWVRSHDTIIRINDIVYLHGGLSPKYAQWPIRKINETVRDELADLQKLPGGIVQDPDGPLWYRGLATGDENLLRSHVLSALAHLGAARFVISHTFADGAVTPRFDGKVLLIDVGLSRVYDNFVRLACLVSEKGETYALQNGSRVDLPPDSSPESMLKYLKAAAAVDTQPSSLQKRIAALESYLAAQRGR